MPTSGTSSASSAISPDDLHPHLYSQHDDAAIGHLFEVTAGLDSAVLGEHEILGQVRTAWELAQRERGAGATLNLLFRHALEVGKRARTETAISRSTTSVSHAAVEMAREVLDGLQGRRVLVLGAGEMSEGMAVALTASGVAEMVVANRTAERARALADRLGERAAVRIAPFADLAGAVAEADLVLTSTGADRPVLDFDIVAGAMSARPERPLMMVDIAVPRDVAPEVDALDGVTRLDLDDLRNWADRGRAQRAGEAAKVRSIVAEEIERYLVESTARQAAPLVAAMRERADLLRQNELERYAKKLADLPADQRAIVDALTKSLVNKLLHEPSVRLKEDAGTPRGERNSAAVRDLFGLQ
ncbi:MAG: glutamyl-tRNA reductase [Ilumatobacteraceae bacterium]